MKESFCCLKVVGSGTYGLLMVEVAFDGLRRSFLGGPLTLKIEIDCIFSFKQRFVKNLRGYGKPCTP
jgi:hypothetical protein